MNPTWITASLAVGGLLVQAGVALATIHFLSKRLDEHGERLDANGGTLGEHAEKLVDHEGRIGRSEGDISRLTTRVFNGRP